MRLGKLAGRIGHIYPLRREGFGGCKDKAKNC